GHKTVGGAPWTHDTISIIFSATKGATATCAHMLADRGKLDLDAPVKRYWPEFAQAGKEQALVSMMLDHSVGLPHVRTPVKKGGFDANSREAHAAEIGSANGISNARGLAGLYAPLANGGELGVKLVGRDTLTRMGLVSVATHDDATLRIPTRFSLGFMKAMDNR